MRGILSLTLSLALLMTIPAVAADDPSFETPDPTPLLTAAGAFKDGVSESVAARSEAGSENASAAAGSPVGSVPLGNGLGVVQNGVGLATDVAVGAHGMGIAAAGWAVGTADTKIQEAGAAAEALDDFAAAVLGAFGGALGTINSLVCQDPIAAAPACGDDSLADEAEGAVTYLAGQALGTSPNADDTVDALEALIGHIADLPE